MSDNRISRQDTYSANIRLNRELKINGQQHSDPKNHANALASLHGISAVSKVVDLLGKSVAAWPS